MHIHTDTILKRWRLATFVAVLLTLRLATLAVLPLIDPTEARYALISHIMLSSGDFITPKLVTRIGELTPFLGKPPLFFWSGAIALDLAPSLELGARLPSFIAALVVAAITWAFATRAYGTTTATMAIIVLISSSMFYASAGFCQIDMLLAACHTASLASFYAAITTTTRQRLWGLMFFAALALGMLTKGPVAAVLAIITISLWLTWERRWSSIRSIPWKWGVPVFLLISAPWYLLAELNNPGFLQYFFLNENFLRYLSTSYGDRYGSSHQVAHGTSWAYLALCAMPWSLYFVQPQHWRFRTLRQLLARCSSADRFVLTWLVAPALFFTFARSVLIAYLIPALPAFAVLFSRFLTAKKALAFLAEDATRVASRRIATLICLLGVCAFGMHVGYTAGLPDTSWGADSFLALAFLAPALALLVFLRSVRRGSGALYVALIFALGFSSASHSLSPYLGDNFSTTALAPLDQAVAQPPNAHLNFVTGIPYSSHLYLRSQLEADVTEVLHPAPEEHELVLYDRKRMAGVPTPDPKNFELVFDAGIWKAYRKATGFQHLN